jgi:hypothetical protein
MSRSNLRIAVIVLTAITLLIHAYLGFGGLLRGGFTSPRGPNMLAILWALNSLGYLGLLVVFMGYVKVAFLQGKTINWALIVFAFVTILAFVFMSGVLRGDFGNKLGLATKADEILLMIAAYMHMRA